MVVQMRDVTKTPSKRHPASYNPQWMPRRIPRWLTIRRAAELLHRKDYKALSERANKLGVTRRNHPFDKRKRQLYMPELLSRLDFDTSVIKFTQGTDYQEPKKADV
jgi:hypothetical protein